MKINELFDLYDLRARLSPSIILIAPILLNGYMLSDTIRKVSTTIIILIISLAISNLLILFSRQQGDIQFKSIFPNEMPAVEFLYPTDKNIDELTKKRYYDILSNRLKSTNFNSEQSEDEIKKNCKTAVKWLKENTRNKEKFPLVLQENINVGFCKNMYGLKRYGIVTSSALIIGIITFCYYQKTIGNNFFSVELMLSIMSDFAFLFTWIFIVNKKLIGTIYKKYAVALLASCEIIEIDKLSEQE